MRLMKLVFVLLVCCVLVVPSLEAQQAAMTNDDVIALAGAGLGDDIVIAKIYAAPATAFDTSLNGLKALKAAGVSSAVIKTMISPKPEPAAAASSVPDGDPNDPASMHKSGVYALAHGTGGDHMTMLPYVVPKQVEKVSSFLDAKFVSILDGPHATVAIQDVNPTFYLYLGNSDVNAESLMRNLQLVNLYVQKQTRELMIGRISSNEPGIDPKVWRGYTIAKVKQGIFKITLAKPLEPGEYAFYRAGTWQTAGLEQDGGEFYEFEVGAKP